MDRYVVTVKNDELNRTTKYIIETDSPQLDRRLLQLAGMVLDEGISPETLRRELPTAQAHASVDGVCYPAKWIDDAFGQSE